MRKFAAVMGVACVLTVSMAQPPATPPKPVEPAKPAPQQPAAQPTAPATPATPATPADTGPKKYEIAADAKPVARQELEGGLIVEDFVVGTGATVIADSVVVANYHGTLKNGGAAFDSTWDPSFQHPEPTPFGLNQVIPGWTKGLPGMKVGGIRRLTIPAAMAYGPQEKKDQTGKVTIPSNSDLVFVVEMIDTVGVEDVKVGTGTEVSRAAVCVIAHTAKTADGKECEKSTPADPYILIPGENQAIDIGCRGMKVGGKRIITIPAMFNRNAPLTDIKRPAGVPLTIEVELVAVRNLPQQGR